MATQRQRGAPSNCADRWRTRRRHTRKEQLVASTDRRNNKHSSVAAASTNCRQESERWAAAGSNGACPASLAPHVRRRQFLNASLNVSCLAPARSTQTPLCFDLLRTCCTIAVRQMDDRSKVYTATNSEPATRCTNDSSTQIENLQQIYNLQWRR